MFSILNVTELKETSTFYKCVYIAERILDQLQQQSREHEALTLRHHVLFVRGGRLMNHFIGIIRLSPPSYTKPLQAVRRGQLRHHAAPSSIPCVFFNNIKSRN